MHTAQYIQLVEEYGEYSVAKSTLMQRVTELAVHIIPQTVLNLLANLEYFTE